MHTRRKRIRKILAGWVMLATGLLLYFFALFGHYLYADMSVAQLEWTNLEALLIFGAGLIIGALVIFMMLLGQRNEGL